MKYRKSGRRSAATGIPCEGADCPIAGASDAPKTATAKTAAKIERIGLSLVTAVEGSAGFSDVV
jgi:hypothetical protein